MTQSSSHRVAAPEPLVSAVVGQGAKRLPVEALHFGTLLLARGIVTPSQLASALEVQASSPYLRIGEILLGMGYLSFAQLKSTLEDQYHDVKLVELLHRLGIVTLEHIEQALEVQRHSGKRLAPILIERGACSEAQIYRAMASQERP